MATFNEDVIINGGLTINEQEDADQLIVKGSSGQTTSLQEWQDSTGNAQAKLTADGRFRVGSDLPGGTPNALVEANEQVTLPTTDPKQGIQAKGVLDGGATAIAEPLTWSAQEMEIQGTGGLSSTHTTLVARVDQQNSGDASAAEVRAGYFEASNQGASTGKLASIKVQVINAGQVDEAAGIEIGEVQNTGTVDTLYGLKVQDVDQGSDNYAIHTGAGKVHLGDVLELAEPPGGVPGTPPAGNVVVYPTAGLLQLLDSSGTIKTMVDLASPQTLTNKTLTAPVISGGSINNTPIGQIAPASGNFSSLIITQAAASARIRLRANAGQVKDILFDSGTSPRWQIASNITAESGGNAGSNFVIVRFDDSGALLGTPLVISRSTGQVQIPNVGITGGAINGTTIGLSTPSNGNFTSLQADSIVNDTGLAAGTYNPTLTPVANIDSLTGTTCQYFRIGNIVHVSGYVAVDPTNANTLTQFLISLPIASNFGGSANCAGTCASDGGAERVAAIRANVANNAAEVVWLTQISFNHARYFTFSYRVL